MCKLVYLNIKLGRRRIMDGISSQHPALQAATPGEMGGYLG
jgi:hypothetical protein